MGNPMARLNQAAGHQLTVHDLRRENTTNLGEMGALWAENPSAVAAASEVVFTSLPGSAEVEYVVTDPDQGIGRAASRRRLHRYDHQLADGISSGGISL